MSRDQRKSSASRLAEHDLECDHPIGARVCGVVGGDGGDGGGVAGRLHVDAGSRTAYICACAPRVQRKSTPRTNQRTVYRRGGGSCVPADRTWDKRNWWTGTRLCSCDKL